MCSADRRPRLLVVDDDEDFCLILRSAFERRGYTVHAAPSLARARHILTGWSPEYAVLDVRLRETCGLELIRDIKGANPAACIVVLTGSPSATTAAEAMKLGASQYLTKPAEVDAIESAFR